MLTNEQIEESGVRHKWYQFIYENTRSMILALSGLSVERLVDIGHELETDLGVFVMDYKGPYLVDDHAYFAEMLRQWPTPWDAFDHAELDELLAASVERGEWPPPPTPRDTSKVIGLNGLTLVQFFLAWAWAKNNAAKYLFSAEAIASGWSPEDAVNAGIRAAVSAAKSLTHAQALMASGDKRLGQEAL